MKTECLELGPPKPVWPSLPVTHGCLSAAKQGGVVCFKDQSSFKCIASPCLHLISRQDALAEVSQSLAEVSRSYLSSCVASSCQRQVSLIPSAPGAWTEPRLGRASSLEAARLLWESSAASSALRAPREVLQQKPAPAAREGHFSQPLLLHGAPRLRAAHPAPQWDAGEAVS